METKEMTKWLRYLFYAHLAGIVASLVSLSWLVLPIQAAQIFCLYKVSTLGERYRKATLFGAIALGLNVVSTLLGSNSLVILAVSVLGFIATWQEYNGHSELVAALDEKLSRNWRSLFWWELAAGILTSVLTMTATVILVVLGEIGTAAITAIITMIMNGVMALVGILYLVYLNRTIKLMEG